MDLWNQHVNHGSGTIAVLDSRQWSKIPRSWLSPWPLFLHQSWHVVLVTESIPMLPDLTIHWANIVTIGSSVWMAEWSSVGRVAWIYCEGSVIRVWLFTCLLIIITLLLLIIFPNKLYIYMYIMILPTSWVCGYLILSEVERWAMGVEMATGWEWCNNGGGMVLGIGGSVESSKFPIFLSW